MFFTFLKVYLYNIMFGLSYISLLNICLIFKISFIKVFLYFFIFFYIVFDFIPHMFVYIGVLSYMVEDKIKDAGNFELYVSTFKSRTDYYYKKCNYYMGDILPPEPSSPPAPIKPVIPEAPDPNSSSKSKYSYSSFYKTKIYSIAKKLPGIAAGVATGTTIVIGIFQTYNSILDNRLSIEKTKLELEKKASKERIAKYNADEAASKERIAKYNADEAASKERTAQYEKEIEELKHKKKPWSFW